MVIASLAPATGTLAGTRGRRKPGACGWGSANLKEAYLQAGQATVLMPGKTWSYWIVKSSAKVTIW